MQGFTVTDYAENLMGICNRGIYTFSYLVLAFRLCVPLDVLFFVFLFLFSLVG